jgi:hypothetical protein
MKKLAQQGVEIALWEAIQLLIPAYCDAVAPTKKEKGLAADYLLSDEDNEVFANLELARISQLLREQRKSKSAAAGSGK